MKTSEFVHKAVVGFIGLSLSVNAYLIKERVSEMATSMSKFGEVLQRLQIDTAILNQRLQHLESNRK